MRITPWSHFMRPGKDVYSQASPVAMPTAIRPIQSSLVQSIPFQTPQPHLGKRASCFLTSLKFWYLFL